MTNNLRISAVTTVDLNNGPGVRLTIWVSGCNHKCLGCHNPELADYNHGKPITDEVMKKIYHEINRRYIDGITISGGDPLCQSREAIEELYDVIANILKRDPSLNVWIYTGYTYGELQKLDTWPQIRSLLHDLCDVLVDGPFEIAKRDITIPYRGSTNQRLIDTVRTKPNAIVTIPDSIFDI